MKRTYQLLFTFIVFVTTFFFPFGVLADESAPSLEHINTTFIQTPIDIAFGSDIAFVAASENTWLIDTSDLFSPEIITSHYKAGCVFRAVDVVLTSSFVAQSFVKCGPVNSLHVMEYEGGQIIESEIGLPGNGAIREISIVGDYAYIVAAHGGFWILNISDLENVDLESTYTHDSSADYRDIVIENGIAYLLDLNGRLVLVDIGNPENPVLMNIYDSPDPANYLGLDVRNGIVYVAQGNDGLAIIDATDTQNIVEMSVIGTDDYARDIDVENGYAYVADTSSIIVFDVSDPFSPRNVVQNDIPISTSKNSLKVKGPYVYVADLSLGLLVYLFDDGINESEEPQGPKPFLDLPWDYEGLGMSFNAAALSMSSYFDHTYPLLSTSIVKEQQIFRDEITTFENTNSDFLNYSSHDGYDWGSSAGTKYGVPQLAAASGIATYASSCGACGNAIYIDHGNGFQTRYYHLQRNGLIISNNGQSISVKSGQQIGLTGFSGRILPNNISGSHVHFMVVEDKNGDGNFDDNIPDGLVDPFGWQSGDPDPWEEFTYTVDVGGEEEERFGNKSHYLWLQELDSMIETVTALGIIVEVGYFKIDFPENIKDEIFQVVMKSSPNVRINDSLTSIGPSIFVYATSSDGSEINSFDREYELIVDFNSFDISAYDADTISIYSSEEGSDWEKENTTVDFDSKFARARIDHLSQFALFAELRDSIPPSTNISLTGDEGEEGWFRSVISVELETNDDSEILYTAYRINGGEWTEYSTPLDLDQDGEYILEYYSEDEFGNTEEVKLTSFRIDTINPEALIYYDIELNEIVIDALYDGDTVSINNVSRRSNSIYTISDYSGNSLTMEVITRNIGGKLHSIKVNTMEYDDSERVSLDRNIFSVRTRELRGVLGGLMQYWKYQDVTSWISYNSHKDVSKIRYRDKNVSINEDLEGLRLLYLQTQNGNLEMSY